MGLFDRYLARSILAATLLVLLVIIFLDAFFGFISESKYVARYESYGYWHALAYIFMRIPGKVIEFLPTITLIGSLLGLGALASNSELIALRAAGMSRGRIIWGGMKTGLLIGLCMLLIGEFVAPKSEVRATAFRAQHQGKPINTELRNFWARNGNDFIHITRANPDYRLSGLKIFTVNEQVLLSKQDVREAQFVDEQWQLAHVTEKQYQEYKVETVFDYTRERKQLIEADLFEVASVQPRNMPLTALDDYIEYLEDNALESSAYRKAFWKKITGPLSILVMMLIAMPFVFANRRAGNAGARLVLGIMFGMAYYIASEMLGNLGQVYHVPVLLSAFTPLLVFTVIGFVLLQRSE